MVVYGAKNIENLISKLELECVFVLFVNETGFTLFPLLELK